MNLNKPSQDENQGNNIVDITIEDFIKFYLINWKIILIYCFLGVTVSSIFILTAPTFYKGIALVQLGRTTNHSMYPNGTPLEDPALLVSRIKHQYSEIASCKRDNGSEYFLMPKRNANVIIASYKALPNTIEISATLNSENQTNACINDLFVLIRNSQYKLVSGVIEDLNDQINMEKNLADLSKNLIDLKKSPSLNQQYLYFNQITKINQFQNNIFEMNKILKYLENNQAYIIGHIKIVTPSLKDHLIKIIIGFFLGMALGSSMILFKNYLSNKVKNSN